MKTDQKCWYILLSRCSESIPPSKANGKAYDESFDTVFTFSVSEGKNVNTGKKTTLDLMGSLKVNEDCHWCPP